MCVPFIFLPLFFQKTSLPTVCRFWFGLVYALKWFSTGRCEWSQQCWNSGRKADLWVDWKAWGTKVRIISTVITLWPLASCFRCDHECYLPSIGFPERCVCDGFNAKTLQKPIAIWLLYRNHATKELFHVQMCRIKETQTSPEMLYMPSERRYYRVN